jgi:hypothetical protein
MNRKPDEKNSLSSVNHQLKKMTTDYLQTHSSLTLNALAVRSGVAATTLRRLMQNEDKGELAPHSVLALVAYLLREKKISKILKMIDGPVADLLNRCFDQFIFDESADHKIDVSLNELFKDRTTYLVYKLAANNCGISIDEIKNTFGLIGLKKINDLLDKGLLQTDDQGRLHAKEKNFAVDLTLAHQLTHSLVDHYKPTDVDCGLNLFYSLSEGLTEAGIKKIKEIEIEAVKNVYEIMNEKKNHGDIPYFSLFMSDVLGLTPVQPIETLEGALQ